MPLYPGRLIPAAVPAPPDASRVTHDSRINMVERNAEQVAGIVRGERPTRLSSPEA